MSDPILERPTVCPHCGYADPQPRLEDVNGHDRRWVHKCGWSQEIPDEWLDYSFQKREQDHKYSRGRGGFRKIYREFTCPICLKEMKGMFVAHQVLCGSQKCYLIRANQKATARYQRLCEQRREISECETN